jgi:hypothetical protein
MYSSPRCSTKRRDEMKEYGLPKAIPPVEVKCFADVFENMIREFGVVNACEWFGHQSDSEFTKETIAVLLERSGLK